MKGMSLPINMIVIVAIAVLVLVVVAAFFVGGLKPLQQIEVENAFNKGCTALRAGYNCAASSISSISISDYYYDSNAATFTVKAGDCCFLIRADAGRTS